MKKRISFTKELKEINFNPTQPSLTSPSRTYSPGRRGQLQEHQARYIKMLGNSFLNDIKDITKT